jgi:hypothetical protein
MIFLAGFEPHDIMFPKRMLWPIGHNQNCPEKTNIFLTELFS